MIATRGLLTTDMLCLSSSDWQMAHMENITVIINSDQHSIWFHSKPQNIAYCLRCKVN